MLPFAIFGLLGLLALLHAVRPASEKQGGALPPVSSGGRLSPGPASPVGYVQSGPPDAIAEVYRRLSVDDPKQPVTRWLLGHAYNQALKVGRVDIVDFLLRKFPEVASKPAKPQGPEGPADPGPGEGVPGGPGDNVTANPTATPDSPLEGVEADDWANFLQGLRTRKPGHRSERYVGQYDHSRARLKALGIPEPTDAAQEDEAIARDMANWDEACQEFIAENCGEVVTLSGENVGVTRSGILGLLKAAGRDGARGWLNNTSDREKFKATTETFKRTNGHF